MADNIEVKPEGKGKPAMWQIYWNEDESTMVDSASKYGKETVTLGQSRPPKPPRIDAQMALLDTDTESSEDEEAMKSRIRGGDVVVFEKPVGNRMNTPIFTRFKAFSERKWESIDMSKKFFSQGSEEADLNLRDPSTLSSLKWSTRLRYCCVNCPRWPLWKDYLWIVGLVIGVILIYIIIVVVIVKTLVL